MHTVIPVRHHQWSRAAKFLTSPASQPDWHAAATFRQAGQDDSGSESGSEYELGDGDEPGSAGRTSDGAHAGRQAPFDVMLTCYTLFERDSADQRMDRSFLKSWAWSHMVLDEAHAVCFTVQPPSFVSIHSMKVGFLPQMHCCARSCIVAQTTGCRTQASKYGFLGNPLASPKAGGGCR